MRDDDDDERSVMNKMNEKKKIVTLIFEIKIAVDLICLTQHFLYVVKHS